MKKHSHQTLPGLLLSLFVAIVFWFVFAPTQLGGPVTYVIVDGNSMEPKFRFGDLVLVRKQSSYQIGDAVTYQNAELGRFVFHRIVDIQADHFVLQGDHNTWLDGYQPNQSEIIGKLWVHIPLLGKVIQWARQPMHLAIGCGLFGGIMAAGIILNPSREGKRNARKSGGNGGLLDVGLYLTGFLAITFLGLTIFAFTRPLMRPAEDIQYQQDGHFTYSAAGTPGIYDSTTIQPGEPIFPKLTCFLNVGMVYNFSGGEVQQIAGSHQLHARIFDEKSGWQRTIPLEAQTSFSGNSYSSRADLDLCQIEAMVTSVEEQTGLHPNMYTMEVISETAISGTLDNQPIVDTFASRLTFKFDDVHFHVEDASEQEDPLHTTKSGLIQTTDQKPTTLSLAGLEITIQHLRTFAISGLAISVSSLLLLSWLYFNSKLHGQADMIRLKYRPLLMDVHRINFQPESPMVDVASIDDLAKLAERQGTMIMHMAVNYLHYYTVQSNGVTYRYVINSRPGQSRPVQALPQLDAPANPLRTYMEAAPLDHTRYGYRVDLNQNEPAIPDEYQTIFLNKIKL